MEKETEQYLIKRINALEDELDFYKKFELDPIYRGFKSADLYDKAMAFDTLVYALGLKYEKDGFIMTKTNNVINKDGKFIICGGDINYDNILKGLDYPLL